MGRSHRPNHHNAAWATKMLEREPFYWMPGSWRTGASFHALPALDAKSLGYATQNWETFASRLEKGGERVGIPFIGRKESRERRNIWRQQLENVEAGP